MVDRKSFGLKNENACIFGRKYKDQYMAYQDDYRRQFGVFPELDKKNKPFTALWDDPYNVYVALKKRGFYGAWFWHDYHGRFNKKLMMIYHTYKNEWSFINSINYSYRTLLDEIPGMDPQEQIVNDLGYRKDEQGNYYEGTWSNGTLVYGLMYLANQNLFCVGSFTSDSAPEFQGVCAKIDLNKRNDGNVTTSIGTFRMKDGLLSLYRSTAFIMVAKIKQSDLKSVTATIGNYDGGYAEGRFYSKTLGGDIRIGWALYKDGEVKREGGGFFDMALHTLLGLYMMPYFMLKFTYGIPFWLIYKAIQKSNWN